MKSLEDYMKLPYRLEVIKDCKGYRLIYPELPGCAGVSFTKEEIEKRAYELRRAWFEAALEDCFPIPEPGTQK